MCQASWAIVYHANSRSPRARRWYHVSRVVDVDGKLFEVYWHQDINLRLDNLARVRQLARAAGLDLLPGIYQEAPAPRLSNEIRRV